MNNANTRAAALVANKLAPTGERAVATYARGLLAPDNSIAIQVNADGSMTLPNLSSSTISGNSSITGNLAVTGTGAVTGNFAINTSKFTVAASSGNTVVAGTLAVTGAQTFTGNTTCSGTLAVTGASTLTGNVTASGTIAVTGAVTMSSTLAVTGAITATAGVKEAVTTISGDGAVTLASGTVVLTKGSAAAITVAAPSSQDGTKIRIISNSDFAHVITFTGSTLLDGTTGANLTVTMTAFKGSAIEVVAVGTKWLLVSSSNVTSITT